MERIVDAVWNTLSGLRNMWRFRRVVWNWRACDYEYSYELFAEGLRGLRDHIAEDGIHVNAREDALSIQVALTHWEDYQTAETWEDEERRWTWFHRHLREHGRTWWD